MSSLAGDKCISRQPLCSQESRPTVDLRLYEPACATSSLFVASVAQVIAVTSGCLRLRSSFLPDSKMTDTVSFDVGGQVVKVLQSVIRSRPDTLLCTMLDDPSRQDEN
eukprot:1766722-Amphidinium_carterae.1